MIEYKLDFFLLNVQWIIYILNSGLAVFDNILISTSGVSTRCDVSFVEFKQFSKVSLKCVHGRIDCRGAKTMSNKTKLVEAA